MNEVRTFVIRNTTNKDFTKALKVFANKYELQQGDNVKVVMENRRNKPYPFTYLERVNESKWYQWKPRYSKYLRHMEFQPGMVKVFKFNGDHTLVSES